jgi:hypothetical protein
MRKNQVCDTRKTIGVSQAAAAEFVDVPLAVQGKLPQSNALNKTVDNSGSFVSRRLF